MKKVYLIDDDDIYVFLTKKTILKVRQDVEVEVFSDGLKAITHLKAVQHQPELLPDVIFLDLNMPVMDGWDFLKEYQKLAPAFVKTNELYIVSSSISPHEMERSKSIPAVSEFIIKPLVKEKFLEILGKL
ncbi:Response regulator receiver domain-containing protein [Pedobacter westerhofensis]|uniref:Response regulator receiver domain-containing protein n=1 Tax=Pedobacter westerhofensis TaxID=425512 RepID=A0A521C548_9SPHI|nr:response regulator [Pedobacter westerhofensis]SMO54554.1 Response regulator receiver domain-containing protein [Pedobacter westerhofensis]